MMEMELWDSPYIDLYQNERNIVQGIELSEFQACFLSGAIKKVRPKKILEIGTSAGGSTCLILNTLNILGLLQTEVITVDLSKTYYQNQNQDVGFLADIYSEQIGFKNYEKYTGCIVAEAIEKIGGDIDFLFLDAAHVAPGEILDFLVCYPFLTENATVVVHDISLMHKYKKADYDITANALLFSSVVAEKFINYDKRGYTGDYPNIGGFQCSRYTGENIENVFLALFVRWHYLLTEEQDKVVRAVIAKYYDKNLLDLYVMAVNINRYSYLDNNKEKNKNNFFKVASKKCLNILKKRK